MKAVSASQGTSEQEPCVRRQPPIPISRLAYLAEIASVVAFLCSEKGSYLAGVVINMDGASVPIVVGLWRPFLAGCQQKFNRWTMRRKGGCRRS